MWAHHIVNLSAQSRKKWVNIGIGHRFLNMSAEGNSIRLSDTIDVPYARLMIFPLQHDKKLKMIEKSILHLNEINRCFIP